MSKQLRSPPAELREILQIEEQLIFNTFTADDAWKLGCLIRETLLSAFPDGPAAVIQITLANGRQTIFRAVTKSSFPGLQPDNDSWVERKLSTVLRWGMSTYAMHYKFGGGDIKKFVSSAYMLGEGKDNAGAYTIHGGGVPIRVRGVEGLVGAIIVSGLKHQEDHQVIIEAVDEYIKSSSTPPTKAGHL